MATGIEAQAAIIALDEPVSEENLKDALKKYLADRDVSPTIKIVLSKPATLYDDLSIEFNIVNKIEINTMQTVEADLLAYLRGNLKNSHLRINYHLSEQSSAERKPYTNSEIFEAMARKNPAILKLRDALGLDTDY